MNYYLTKDGVGTTIVNCSVAVVYFVILCYFCHGITLGKYIMKLRIVSANEKELNMGHYLIRGLFANLILSNLVSIVFVLTMNKETFVSIYPKVSNVLTIILLATILFIMYRNDGRGLHDLISNTEVIYIDLENKDEVRKTEDTKDAVILEEKKTKKEGEVDGKRVIRTRNSSKRKS